MRKAQLKMGWGSRLFFNLLPAHDFAFNPGLPKSILGFFLCIGFVKLLTSGQKGELLLFDVFGNRDRGARLA